MKNLIIVFFFLFSGGIFIQTKAQEIQYSLKNSLIRETGKIVNSDSLQKKPKHKIVPRTATLRSLVLPGLGQIYNRQYWKLPLVYGGFGVIAWAISFNDLRYGHYLNYYMTFAPGGDNYQKANTSVILYGTTQTRDLTENQLKSQVDFYRRNRDLSYIALVLMWGLNIVDANVSAHLKTFDLSDDISLKVQPNFDMNNPSYQAVAGIKMTINFNSKR